MASGLRDDPKHAACVDLLATSRSQLVIPSACLVEVEYALRATSAFAALLREITTGAFGIYELSKSDLQRVGELLEQYRSLRLGFVDASVLATVEALGESELATLDHRHFSVVKPRHCKALKLLP